MVVNMVSIDDKIVKLIETQIKIEYDKVNVEAGKCRYNFRCQMNAVHDAIKKKDTTLGMMMCMHEDRYPFIHFVNIHKGKYIDNTLGVWSEEYDYYLIKVIKEEDFFDINTIFADYREYLKMYPPFYLRWFSTIEL